MKLWLITPKVAYAQNFERCFGCGAFILDREPTRHIVSRPDSDQLDIELCIESVTIQNGNYDDNLNIFAYMVNCEPVDLKQVKEATIPVRIAAQDLPRSGTAKVPDNYRDNPVTKCVICGAKMKPRRGKFCCSEKCRQAKKRQQIPLPESDE